MPSRGTCLLLLAALLLSASPILSLTRPRPQDSGQSASSAGEKQQKEKTDKSKDKRPQNGQEPKDAASPPNKQNPPENPAGPRANTETSLSPPAVESKPQAQSADTVTLVWVNTASRVYHLPGTRWYGKTKRGKYMTEADARRAGYRPATKEKQ